MSDSSSVDRWHPSNVEKPERWELNFPEDGKAWVGPHPDGRFVWYDAHVRALDELCADRGRVLAAARELAEAVEGIIETDVTGDRQWLTDECADKPGHVVARLSAVAASFREVDHG